MLPPGVVTVTVTPPGAGDSAALTVTWVSETVWMTARVEPKYTSMAPARLRPVMTISWSLPETGPAAGLMPVRAGNGL